jgi:phosphatidylserine decarboxylase
LEQIKGQSFTVDQFLGPKIDQSDDEIFSYRCDDRDNRLRYQSSLLKNPESNELFYSVIYLAPGDYHRFHSPCDFRVTSRRHFPGALYSVNPRITCWFDNLFIMNERVSLYGEWMHGFFSYTAVGATMVGSIKLPWDDKLKTNQYNWDNRNGEFTQRNISKHFIKGEEIGEFNLGSTIVLIFEAPRHYKFPVRENEQVKLGQRLTMKMQKRHSMPNLHAVNQGADRIRKNGKNENSKKQNLKASFTFESSKQLRHRFLQ